MDARSRVDAELREHRHAITNAFTQEELAGLSITGNNNTR